MHVQSLSHIQLFATPRTVAHTLSMEFFRQEYWSGLPPSSWDLPEPGMEPMALASPALAGGFFTPAPPGKPHVLGRGRYSCPKALCAPNLTWWYPLHQNA